MDKYGLIGEKLSHSFSPIIHNQIGGYEYNLIEIAQNDIENYFNKKAFTGLNVTIPYKKTVIPFMNKISKAVEKIGALNTVINDNGKLYGFNTDYYGLKYLLSINGLDVKNKDVLILGTGGTSDTAYNLVLDLGANNVKKVSRCPKKDIEISYYQMYELCNEYQVIINTTPVGMSPAMFESPIDLSKFDRLEAVIDVIYNPLRTRLILDAREKGIKCDNGLYMLIYQAVSAAFIFEMLKIEDLDLKNDMLDAALNLTPLFEKNLHEYIESKQKIIDDLYKNIIKDKENIVLIGMPGAGKTTLGNRLKNIINRPVFDTDDMITEYEEKTPEKIIKEKGESYFRGLESIIVKDASRKNGAIIATGGGAVLREENVKNLKLNGKLFFIDIKFEELSALSNRPLSNTLKKLEKVYKDRYPIYSKIADESGGFYELSKKILDLWEVKK